MTAGDKAVVTVRVDVEPAVAFAVFTEDIDLWWRRGPAYRIGGTSPGAMTFEPRNSAVGAPWLTAATCPGWALPQFIAPPSL